MLATIHQKVKGYTGSDRSAIVAWTIGIKVCCVPLYFISAKMKRKLNSIQSLLKATNTSVPKSLIMKGAFTQKRVSKLEISRELKAAKTFIYERNNISSPMLSLFAPLLQIPFWTYASLSLRKMSGMGSFLPDWISNSLHVPVQLWDLNNTGFWTLAVYIGMIHSLNCYLFPAPSTRMKYILAGLSGISIPIAGLLPESVVLFWCTSSSFTFFQNLLFESKLMDKHLGKKESKIEYKSTSN